MLISRDRKKNIRQQVFIDDIDLIALSRSGSIDDLCTCMICYGKEENGVRTTIESIEYDDGRYYSPKGHIRIYDREAHQKWSRYRAYDYTGQGEFDGYVNGAFEYETDSPQELFNRGLSELKQRNDKKVSYEAELYDLQADIGDTIRIADNRYQEKLYLSARVQEVQNHYTVNGEDTGKLANYSLMESKRTQDVEDMLKELQGKVVSIDYAEISYQIGESGTEPPDGEWSSEPVDAEAGKYLWTRTITYYTNSSRNTAYSIAKSGLNGEKGESGDKGDKGDTGPAGKGISSTEVTYQASTSGTSIPTGTWVTSIPSVAAGSYLWTRTIITYTDKTSTTSYAVGKMGNTGATGKGIKSTSITYQAHSNGTTAPTGTWTDLVPATSAEKPYLWSRTILTYTDNTTSTTYSVGSTPDGVLEEIRKVLRYDNTKIVLGQDGEPTSLELTNEGLTVKSDSEDIISVTGENREVTSDYDPSGATFTRRYGKIVNADGTIISCGNTVAENDYEIAEIVQYTGVDPLLSGHEAGIDITAKIAGVDSGTNKTETDTAQISIYTIQNSRAPVHSRIDSAADWIEFRGKQIKFYPTKSFGISGASYGASIGITGKGIGLYPTEELELGIPAITGDCNKLTKSCTWYLGNGSTNRPLNQNGWLISRSYSTDYCHQTYITNTGGIYRRMMQAGKWGIWQGGYANVKKLWSGTLSKGGSVTVANLSLFDTFILGTSGGTAMLIGTRYYDQYQNRGTTVLFTAGHDDGTTSYLYKATTSMSGTTFKLTSCSVHTLDPTGCGGHAATVKSLYGVM